MNASKALLVSLDGLGDRLIPELKGKTPLEAAKKPNLDRLAREGITGLMNTVAVGVRPGSDTSHLCMLGYDPKEYYTGRGPIEAAGVGIFTQAGDVALRGNFGTVDEKWIIKDRRAGRILDVSELCKALDGLEINGVTFNVKAGTGHRAAVVMRGKGLSSQVSEADPHVADAKVAAVKALDGSREAAFTAQVLNAFMEKSHAVLKAHPLNLERVKGRKLPANFLLLRGAGMVPRLPSFQEKWGLKGAGIAGGGLYKGIIRLLDMELIAVKGATGLPDTDVKAKFAAAREALKTHDFVFVHVKATDIFGEDGNWKAKKEFIEKVDKGLAEVMGLKEVFIAITADHSTACCFKAHTADPVPLVIRGNGVRVDDVKSYGERACAKGGLGRITGLQLLPLLVDLMGRARLYGA
ncbi:MAG TPA: 2,3-bisphosphoglycerate-independent phosphoglycerate mutase [Candidatus Diapherotrites archaeon]|uniref:2,3-bisphosphoglycerate-independent phosphoglycerate mutase n=1 Tax=Candidatus Iainarchaeum sp. TaxID=3101447 RepID=A0A7J4JJQ3_9ARCH|nr:2,3-bisphosphoglycerate-independent phosphoglycerate mutase [Candidatus Diapherotrites archaeon]HIH16839.1 2,3-bisphosphoglycerate-independent phosphoglycerate mutase [Candidatus Diapherotrites archaeon]